MLERTMQTLKLWNQYKIQLNVKFIYFDILILSFSILISLILNFWIFPVTVVGKSSTIKIYFGTLKWANFFLQNALISSTVVFSSFDLSLIHAHNSSPNLSSGTPTTQAPEKTHYNYYRRIRSKKVLPCPFTVCALILYTLVKSYVVKRP